MYEPRRVLLTGVAGFICTNLALYLVSRYPSIRFVGIDKMTYCSDRESLAQIEGKDNFRFVELDLLNQAGLTHLMKEECIDTVLHLAAFSHVQLSFTEGLTFTYNNVIATQILLDVSKQEKIRRFIHVSTDEVYGSKEGILTEDSIMDPTNPYSASKAAAEHIVRAYYHSFQLPIIITRGNNVFGPHQYPEKVILRFILRLLKGLPAQIQGTGEQQRSFLYVDDVCRAFETILFKGTVGETYNIGSDREWSIREVATKLIGLIHSETETKWVEYIPDRLFNDTRYYISSDKLKSLGWKQEIDFTEGLVRTIQWYRDHQHKWDL